jgi:hypothetical protein
MAKRKRLGGIRMWTWVVLGTLVVLAVVATSASIILLRRGKFYNSLKPESRPRRWVLILLLLLFAVFLTWFPIWMVWPEAIVSKILSWLFAVSFFAFGMAIKWVPGLIDSFVVRRGWPLR